MLSDILIGSNKFAEVPVTILAYIDKVNGLKKTLKLTVIL